MIIRHAAMQDLDAIMAVYAAAKNIMLQTGNTSQWLNGYPSCALVEEDIRRQVCYVAEADGTVCGVFALILGEDPTYQYIEDGAWLNDEPYGTIHRMGSDGSRPGVFAACIAYCRSVISNLRVDTHRDNPIMQHLAQKHGFRRCGIIYVADGSPRVAFQSVST